MTPLSNLTTAPLGISLPEANQILRQSKKGKLPIIDKDGNLRALVARSDLIKTRDYPRATKSMSSSALNDKESGRSGQLLVAAAVSTHPEDLKVHHDFLNSINFFKLRSPTHTILLACRPPCASRPRRCRP